MRYSSKLSDDPTMNQVPFGLPLEEIFTNFSGYES
jgi:hypothetical protein